MLAFRQLSRLTQAFLVGVALSMIIIVSVNWTNIFLVPIVFGSPAFLLWIVYYKKLRIEATQDETVFRMFAAGAVLGSLIAMAVELLVSLIVGAITIGPQFVAIFDKIAQKQAEDPTYVPSPADMALTKDFGYWMYVFLNAFLVAALVEETVKAAMVRHACCGCDDRAWCLQRPDPRPKNQAFATVSLMLAASLGFSLSENILYVFASGGSGPGFNDELGFKVLLAAIRAVLAMPVHATCACFTGLRLTLRDLQRRQRDAALLAQAASSGVPQFAVLPSGVSIPMTAGGGLAVGQASASESAFPPGTTFAAMPSGHSGIPQYSQAPSGTGYAAPLVSAGPVQAVPVSSLIQSLYTPTPGVAPGTVSVGMPVAPPPTGHGRSDVAAPAAPPVDPSTIKVWSWPRVLWPAVLIHGCYDWIAMLLAELDEEHETAAVVLTLLFATIIVIASVWALQSQFRSCFEDISEGRAPSNMTCAPIWWPNWVRRLATRVCHMDLPEIGWPGAPAARTVVSWGSGPAGAQSASGPGRSVLSTSGIDTTATGPSGSPALAAQVGGSAATAIAVPGTGGGESLAYAPQYSAAGVDSAAGRHWQSGAAEGADEQDTAPLVGAPRK